MERLLNKLQGSERRFDESTDQFDVAGEEHGAKRVLSVMNIVQKPGFPPISREMALSIATKHFERHCSQIGWWPSGEFPDVVVNQREDGSWHGVAYLKPSMKNKSKPWEEFPQVNVDTRTSQDA